MTNKISYTCAYCGEQIENHRGDYVAKLRFCNMDCYNKYRNLKRKKGPEPNVTCAKCGKQFYLPKSRLAKIRDGLAFCSISCASSYRMQKKNSVFREDMNATCAYCGRKFHKKPSHLSGLNFCSVDCKRKYHDSRRVVKHCLTCGKEFSVVPSKKDTAKFCSVACHDEYQRRFFIHTQCAYCGRPINVSGAVQYHNKTGKYFCSNKCVGKFFRGERSIQYTGNSDVFKVLRTYFGLYQRPLVFQRDNKICQICGQLAEHVHHIIPIYQMVNEFKRRHPEVDVTRTCYQVAQDIIKEFSEFTNLDNLISVCSICHNNIHHKDRKTLWKGERTMYTNYMTLTDVHFDTSEAEESGGTYKLDDISIYRNDIVGGNGYCAHEQEDGSLVIDEVETKSVNGMDRVSVSVKDIIPANKWRIG